MLFLRSSFFWEVCVQRTVFRVAWAAFSCPVFLVPCSLSLYQRIQKTKKKIKESFTDSQADMGIAFRELLPNESAVVLVPGACTQPPAPPMAGAQSSRPGSQASPDSSREDKGTGMEEKVISGRDSLTFVIVPKNV